MRERILETIKKSLDVSVCEEDNLIDVNADSITMITMLVDLEKEFGFETNDEDLDYNKYITFSDIIDMVENQVEILK